MRYRTTTLLARQAMPAIAGTQIIDIPITDIISAFRFHIEVLPDATKKLSHGLDVISKIEIVDGSDVLMELSAAQMEALHFYERGKLGNITVQDFGAVRDEFYTAVYFGRWAFDNDLALDPSKFENPQLRITYNGAVYNAGVAAGGIHLSIFADIFDEFVPSPIGFLQHREFYRYTPVANAYHYINLPRDLCIRKIFLQGHQYTRAVNDAIAEARMDENNMKRIPFDMLFEDWLAWDRQEYGPVEHGMAASREGGALPLYTAISTWPIPIYHEVNAAPVLRTIGVNGCQTILSDGGAETTTYIGRMVGHLPHFTLCYPFGDQKDLADWYETKDIGTLRLRILNGATILAACTNRVILQQLRRY